MATQKPRKSNTPKEGASNCKIAGHIEFEALNVVPTDVKLAVYAFSASGKLLGSTNLDRKGTFSFNVPKAALESLDLLIGKAGDPKQIRTSAVYSHHYGPDDWISEKNNYLLEPGIFVSKLIWWPWWPKRICVNGHIYKTPSNCPVPFTKVEIFDVDREWCLWPILYRVKDKLLDLRVKRLEDLLREPFESIGPVREPWPISGPGPVESPTLPLPPPKSRFEVKSFSNRVNRTELTALGPQPEPPDTSTDEQFQAISESPDLGATREINQSAITELSNLTITSKLPPWVVLKRCFYSKQLICTTNTDENGYFNCCFTWWPLHIRHGRLRLDWRPDIIIKVTQVIDGVERVIYMDPYASTRWNITNATIDLYLDDPDIDCGNAGDQDRPVGTSTFFTRIGNDEVYWIDQTAGPNQGLCSKPPLSNTAYGRALRIFAQFGDTISKAAAIPGATPPYYYKLSYSLDGTHFTPIARELKDTRVHKMSLLSESVVLGPKPVGSEPALYEVRDFENYYWYNPDWIGYWVTATVNSGVITKRVADGTYILRLEVFDSTGTLLDSTKVDYIDGTVAPPAVLPPHYPCDMNITIDNNPPEVDMNISPTPSGCGVIPFAAVPPLNVHIDVDQANGRIRNWGLYYVKGTNPTPVYLDSGSNLAGISPVPHVDTIDATASPNMLAGVTTTCAFSLKLWAWAHIRNGYGFVYYDEQIQSIAVEKCP